MDNKYRKLYNEAIISRLKLLIDKYPDIRFGQLLINCDIIQLNRSETGEVVSAKDPFNDESEEIWERMCRNKFAFSEQYN